MADCAPELNPLDGEAVSALVTDALARIGEASSLAQLKTVRTQVMGDQAPLIQANRTIGSLDPADRAQAGKTLGGARKQLATALSERESVLRDEEEARALETEAVDVTVPTGRQSLGARHPLETLMEEVADLFVSMGWDIAEGPEIEHEWFNFDALNFDIDHPARQMQDTLYVDGRSVGGDHEDDGHLVMRTHTSPVQARSMLARGVPLYVACPGKVFRSDALDATHTPVFHQVEGLAVDRHLTMAHLKGTLDHFARQMFGPDARGCAPASSPSLNRAPRWICGSRRRRAAPAGLNGVAAAWSTQTCCAPAASTLTSIPVSHSAWVLNARSCCVTASLTCTTLSRETCASPSSSDSTEGDTEHAYGSIVVAS